MTRESFSPEDSMFELVAMVRLRLRFEKVGASRWISNGSISSSERYLNEAWVFFFFFFKLLISRRRYVLCAFFGWRVLFFYPLISIPLVHSVYSRIVNAQSNLDHSLINRVQSWQGGGRGIPLLIIRNRGISIEERYSFSSTRIQCVSSWTLMYRSSL